MAKTIIHLPQNVSTLTSVDFNTPNAIYVIEKDYQLVGDNNLDSESTVEIKENCTLLFLGGTFSGATLQLNNTVIEGASKSISCKVTGTQYELDADAFNLTQSIMQSIVNTVKVLHLHGEYDSSIFNNIQIGGESSSNGDSSITIFGNGATINVIDPTQNNDNEQIEYCGIHIQTNDFVKITDIKFVVSSGCAIIKDAYETDDTKLSYLIDRCHFNVNSKSNGIMLICTREGNITNCTFEGGKPTSEGIFLQRAVNTNVIGCLFSDLGYGIHCQGVVQNGTYDPHTCGLNVQSAIILGCNYGVWVQGSDSFFLNNSMIDYCIYPLTIVSQDGANVTNNYLSNRISTNTNNNNQDFYTIRIYNESNYPDDYNKKIIISKNTIVCNQSNSYGIYMNVVSTNCLISDNTIEFFTKYGIHLYKESFPEGDNPIEKLVIDNNRFAFDDRDNIEACIGNCSYDGTNSIVLSNNYVVCNESVSLVKCTSGMGNYLYHNNHRMLPESSDAIKIGNEARNTTRYKIPVVVQAYQNSVSVENPFRSIAVLVSIANMPYFATVSNVSADNILLNVSSMAESYTFYVIVEWINNI